MKDEKCHWGQVSGLLDEMVEDQRVKLLLLGRKIIPTLTSEDILQPNDYPELEQSPLFRYEEGILAGLQSSQMALRVLKNESVKG